MVLANRFSKCLVTLTLLAYWRLLCFAARSWLIQRFLRSVLRHSKIWEEDCFCCQWVQNCVFFPYQRARGPTTTLSRILGCYFLFLSAHSLFSLSPFAEEQIRGSPTGESAAIPPSDAQERGSRDEIEHKWISQPNQRSLVRRLQKIFRKVS